MKVLKKNKILLKNGLIFFEEKLIKSSLLIKNGYIIDIFQNNSNLKNEDITSYYTIDCENYLITPSLFDAHVHTRNPGFQYKETVDSFVSCCINGGILDVISMGNINPRPTNLKNYNYVQKNLKNSFVNFYQVANISLYKNSVQETVNFKELKKKTILFSDDGAPVIKDEVMKRAIKLAKENNVFLLLHEEYRNNNNNNACYYQNKFLKKNQLPFLDSKYEWKMIQRDLKFNENIDCKMHFQHLSTAKSLKLIEKFKKKLKNLSCEVTFNHLALNNKIIDSISGKFKVNPPIPTPYSQKKLLEGIKNNVIDIIVSDHAPHTEKEKNCHFDKAMYGLTSCELLFPVIYSIIYKKKRIPLETLIKKITTEPFKLFFNIDHKIFFNNFAKISVFDIKLYKKVTKENIFSKGKNTLFLNKYLTGWCQFIIYKNKIIKNQ